MTLEPNHFEDLKKSGLSDEIIKSHGFRSLNKEEIKTILDRSDIENGYEIPYPGPNKKFLTDYKRIKPSIPIFNSKTNSFSKYLSKKDSGCRIYFPWPVWNIIDDPNEPFMITEGEKKALKATMEGFNCIAISGVTCAHEKDTKQEIPLRDFNLINLKNRYVYIVFDGDKVSNPLVLEAQFKLGKSLTKKKGAKVRIINLPEDYKLDDYLVEKGSEALQNLTLNYYEEFADYLVNPNMRYQQARIACHYLKLIYSTANHEFYQYGEGVYRLVNETSLQAQIMKLLKDDLSPTALNQIIEFMKTIKPIPQDELNTGDILNLKNGLFDINSYTLKEHSEKIYSTIQFGVSYEKSANCPIWKKSLGEILENDSKKIEMLQEYFGYCLTKDIRYRKALIMWGPEGFNGKGVITGILQEILSTDNYSAIGIDQLNNPHYTIGLFGKLVNIASETRKNFDLNDGLFKSIVTGDPITADQKFKPAATFNPFCKMIISTNNLPRVEDKTDAFFDRLLILLFNVQFKNDPNRNLKHELRNELNGIFLWSLEGLKRLRDRGYFEETKDMGEIINDYKSDNNNVIPFVDDECVFDEKKTISVKKLYLHYQNWCRDSGHHAMTKINFGKELRRNFKKASTKKMADGWIWEGIDYAFFKTKSESV